jgi:hypothetical protein
MEASYMSGARIEVPIKTCWIHILCIEVIHMSMTLNGYFRLAIKNGVNFLVSATGVGIDVE